MTLAIVGSFRFGRSFPLDIYQPDQFGILFEQSRRQAVEPIAQT